MIIGENDWINTRFIWNFGSFGYRSEIGLEYKKNR